MDCERLTNSEFTLKARGVPVMWFEINFELGSGKLCSSGLMRNNVLQGQITFLQLLFWNAQTVDGVIIFKIECLSTSNLKLANEHVCCVIMFYVLLVTRW